MFLYITHALYAEVGESDGRIKWQDTGADVDENDS